MKKTLLLLSMLCMAFVFAACSDDDNADGGVLIGVTTHRYTLNNAVDATVDVHISALEPVTADVDVPVNFTGADEGTDFEASAHAFHLSKGQTDAAITLTRKLVGKPKTLMMTLQKADGVSLGIMNYSQIDLIGANVYSFEESESELALTKSYVINLETATGARFSFADTTKVDVVIDEAGTAVEGTHFKFANDEAKAVFPAGSTSGTVSLEFLKLEEGKDRIVLRLADHNSLMAGSNASITIKIVGPGNFKGTWAFDKVSNGTWLNENMGADYKVLFDGTAEGDRFTLDGETGNYIFTPHFTGGLQNYFANTGKATGNETRQERLQESGGYPPPKVQLNVLRFEGVNVAFSATDKNIRTARVGLRLTGDEETGEEVLEMTIYDYEPTENTVSMSWGMTWKDMYDMMAYSGDDPLMLSMPIRLHFKRVK